jgi:hypothetical protein
MFGPARVSEPTYCERQLQTPRAGLARRWCALPTQGVAYKLPELGRAATQANVEGIPTPAAQRRLWPQLRST